MPKQKDTLVDRAKQLNGKDNLFEVQLNKDEVYIYCASCNSKFKVDEFHLKSQYQAHTKTSKHKNSSEKNRCNHRYPQRLQPQKRKM